MDKEVSKTTQLGAQFVNTAASRKLGVMFHRWYTVEKSSDHGPRFTISKMSTRFDLLRLPFLGVHRVVVLDVFFLALSSTVLVFFTMFL